MAFSSGCSEMKGALRQCSKHLADKPDFSQISFRTVSLCYRKTSGWSKTNSKLKSHELDQYNFRLIIKRQITL
jgi:hypothetical protein